MVFCMGDRNVGITENQVPLTQKEGKILHCSERRGIYKGIGWHDCNGVQR